jgi:hypothetical protein
VNYEGDFEAPVIPQLLNVNIHDDRTNSSMNLHKDVSPSEPRNYREARASTEWPEWQKAMKTEMLTLAKANTWTLTNKPKHKTVNIVGCRWVFKKKLKSDGSIEKYKARLVAQGFTQQHGVDYHDTFSPVLDYTTLKVMLSLINRKNYELKHSDVVGAFLHGELIEEIYMAQPEGFDTADGQVCKLNKALYGTKQGSMVWYNKYSKFVIGTLKYNRCTTDNCVYVKKSKTGRDMYLLLFVDDILMSYDASDVGEYEHDVALMSREFDLKQLGDAVWFLGMKITRDRQQRILQLDQHQYLEQTLAKFGMENCKGADTPEQIKPLPKHDGPVNVKLRQLYQEVVGSLLYAATSTRPDIAHAVIQASKHNANPNEKHWIAVKQILRYVRRYTNEPLIFTAGTRAKSAMRNGTINAHSTNEIRAYCDSDWAGDPSDRKSMSGYVICFNNDVISWVSKRQNVVALSSAEAEYMAITTTAQEVRWMKQLLSEVLNSGMQDLKSNVVKAIIHSDNQSAIAISNNNVSHGRSKHIDIRYHFIRQDLKDQQYELIWISGLENPADMFTKPLGPIKFNQCRMKIKGGC